MNGGEIDYNNRHMVRWVRATFWCLQAPTIRVRWAGGGSERRKRRSATFRGCREDDEARRAASSVHDFHHNEDQSGLVNWGRRVSSTGSNGSNPSESVRGSLGGPTWLPWFASASGACRAPDDGLGIRASVSGSERANGAIDELCRSRCVQNSGGFIIWRAAYLRTSAPPKPPASHGRTTVSRTLFVSRGHVRIYCVLIIKK